MGRYNRGGRLPTGLAIVRNNTRRPERVFRPRKG